jgi:hypothetical protein
LNLLKIIDTKILEKNYSEAPIQIETKIIKTEIKKPLENKNEDESNTINFMKNLF